MKIKLLSIAFMLILFSGFTMNVHGEEEQGVPLKIGYVDKREKENIEYGNYGYCYDYLKEILKYSDTDYDVEFVYCDVNHVIQDLADGTIDLLAPVRHVEGLEEHFVYSQMDLGYERNIIVGLDSPEVLFNDFDSLQSERIVVRQEQKSELEEYAKTNGYNFTIDVSSNLNILDGLYAGDYKYAMIGSMTSLDGLEIAALVNESPVYYITTKDKQWLMNDIDQSMKLASNNQYLLQEKMYLKHYDFEFENQTFITKKEFDLIQKQGTYTVGYVEDFIPFTYKDSKGKPVGASIDLLNRIALKSGVKFNYIDVTRNPDQIHTVDILIDRVHNLNGESSVYYSMPYMLLSKRGLVGDLKDIGVLSYFKLTDSQLMDIFGTLNVTVYDDYKVMYDDYEKGKLKHILLNTISYSVLGSRIKSEESHVSVLDDQLELTFGYGDGISKEEARVFNKLISLKSGTLTEYSLMQHYGSSQSIEDFLSNNPQALWFVGGVLVVVVCASLGYVELRKRRVLKESNDYDYLTGLLSVSKFIEMINKKMKDDDRTKWMVVSLDIDNFKYLNEIYGYRVGTKVLVKVSKIFEQSFLCARAEGDKFYLLISEEVLHKKSESEFEISQKIVKMINSILGESFPFSFSVGIAPLSISSYDVAHVIDCANIARMKGKGLAENTVNYFTSEMDKMHSQTKDIVYNMEQSLSGKEFIVYYQPKFDLKTMKLVGAEALVRWVRDGQIVSPGEFIPLFEKNGFIEKLDFYVFRDVLQFFNTYKDLEIPPIAVNLSGITLMKGTLISELTDLLIEYDVDSSKIEIEITESAIVDNFETAIIRIEQLQKMGFSISMDDFGAGVSSLNRLRKIPLDRLKIDRDFIIDLTSQDTQRGNIIVKSIIFMANELEIETVGEGIETIEQLEMLRQLGCDVGQGYYYSKPLPVEMYLEKIKNEH